MMRYLLVMNRNKTLVQCNLKFDKRFRKKGEKQKTDRKTEAIKVVAIQINKKKCVIIPIFSVNYCKYN